ncbi:MAG: HAD family hydrolase [Spirochaetia bacterium]|nr:HAD family hydrolase [Spirochaetia bacterium]
MKYCCLILDHDDTAVNSTPYLHYPAHIEVMKELRPEEPPVSLEDWMLKNFSPGIMEYMVNELMLTPEEVAREYEIWQEYIADKQAAFFPGFIDLLKDYHNAGGILTVVSHSIKEKIMQDYASVGAENLIQAAYGWDMDSFKRKPSPYPVLQILEEFRLNPDEALIVDDLRPAISMARSSGVAIGAAGWGIVVPEISHYMKKHSDFFFKTINDFREFLFEE